MQTSVKTNNSSGHKLRDHPDFRPRTMRRSGSSVRLLPRFWPSYYHKDTSHYKLTPSCSGCITLNKIFYPDGNNLLMVQMLRYLYYPVCVNGFTATRETAASIVIHCTDNCWNVGFSESGGSVVLPVWICTNRNWKPQKRVWVNQ